jgi:serine/threonine-protein kinase
MIPFPTPGTSLASTRGTYVVGNLIGDGQYGSVYETRGPFDELYALKMYRPANRHYETVKQEWSAEMKRLESFRHPNIVYIYDAFEVNHLFYIVLERCDTSLRVLSQQPFHDALLFELTRQLLMALSYLHDMGLVHADLHGGNVLVTQLQTRPIIKLTDFGVAHELTGQHWFRPQVANPKILTPELITAGYTTRQSDLYQLGLLMYRMHTGQSAVPEGVQYHDFTRLIAEGVPRQRAEQLRTPIGNVIAKLLRRRDAYRYQSAREVWEDLRLLRPKGLTGLLRAMQPNEGPPSSSRPLHVSPPPSMAQPVSQTIPQPPPSHPTHSGPPPTPRERRNTPTPPMGAQPTQPVGGQPSATPTPPMGVPAVSGDTIVDPSPPSVPEPRSSTGTLPPDPPSPPGSSSGTPFRDP